MNRKGFAVAFVLAFAVSAAASVPAGAAVKPPKPKYEHKVKLKSSKLAQVCVNPTAPPTEGEAYPVNAASCGTYLPHAYAVGKPGQPGGPWAGSIKGASWISFTPTAESRFNETSPAYYYYEVDFTASCPSAIRALSVSGEMMADNSATVLLNGHMIGGASANYNGPPATFTDETTTDVVNGTNKLQMYVYDTGGWTGTDFLAQVDWNC